MKDLFTLCSKYCTSVVYYRNNMEKDTVLAILPGWQELHNLCVVNGLELSLKFEHTHISKVSVLIWILGSIEEYPIPSCVPYLIQRPQN